MRTIYQTAGCVLALYDESTGRAVDRDVCRIYDRYGRKCICKDNGIYVLLGQVEGTSEIIIESEIYQRKCIQVSGGNEQIYYVWLMPGEKNELAFNGTGVVIEGKPNQRVDIVIEQPALPYHIMKNADRNSRILQLYHMQYDIVAGRWFRLVQGKKTEDIQITEKMADNQYALGEKLANSYDAEKVFVYPLIRIETNEKGRGVAVLRDVGEYGSVCSIITDYGSRTIHLQYKEIVKVNGLEDYNE